jgi:heme exporter protein D
MNWNNLNDFLNMGGYGLYVWGSVLMTLALLAGEVLSLRMHRNSFMKGFARRARQARKDRQ